MACQCERPIYIIFIPRLQPQGCICSGLCFKGTKISLEHLQRFLHRWNFAVTSIVQLSPCSSVLQLEAFGPHLIVSALRKEWFGNITMQIIHSNHHGHQFVGAGGKKEPGAFHVATFWNSKDLIHYWEKSQCIRSVKKKLNHKSNNLYIKF